MKIAKERIIFDNYSPWETYSDEEIKEMILESGNYTEDEITESDIWERRDWEMENWWDDEKENISGFFKGKTVVFFGSIGRWNGVFKGSIHGEFWDCFYKAIKDCDYWKIYDENGHLYLTCSHHDGTCHFEIAEVTDKGNDYLNRCDENWRDPNYNQLIKKYSRLPRFSEKMFGCKAREYKESTKADLISKLHNEAKSFYS